MGYWLADAREGQEAGFLKRFAATHWTVNFPRPMMASVVTIAPDAAATGSGPGLRVDTVFYGSGDLAGLIWEAEDKWSHPLLACTLRHRGTGQGGGADASGRDPGQGIAHLPQRHVRPV